MCIRDRGVYDADVLLNMRMAEIYFDEKTVTPDALIKAVTAVSYTHLRAHETVLDLVCRLLLEKKHNQAMLPHINSLIYAM